MKSTGNKILNFIKGCRYGSSVLDRFIIFIYIFSTLLTLSLLYVILGKEKTGKILVSNSRLFNWIPIEKVTVNFNGILLSLPLALDYMMLVWDNWELEEKEFMKKVSKNNGIILDIGSNVGYHTTMLAKENINSTIISVEASPTIFKILQENCTRNKFTNIIFYNNAVTEQDDVEIDFYKKDTMSTIDKQLLDDWSIPDDDIKKERTKTITIDTLLEREQISKVLLLKMDIEGAEVLALSGAKSSLKQKKIQNILIEYHSNSNRDHIMNLLTDSGYTVEEPHERFNPYETNDRANGHLFAVLSSD